MVAHIDPRLLRSHSEKQMIVARLNLGLLIQSERCSLCRTSLPYRIDRCVTVPSVCMTVVP